MSAGTRDGFGTVLGMLLVVFGPAIFAVVSLTQWRRTVREGGVPATPRETVLEIGKALGGAALILAIALFFDRDLL